MTKTASCQNQPLAIAVTGIGGIFPGADNLDQFWKMIEEGKSAVAKVPDGRWPEDAEKFHHPTPGRPDSVLSPNCCAIRNIPQNYSGINLPQDLIDRLDPLFKITLQAGRDAFFSTRRDKLDLNRVQVILANIVLPTDSTSEITRKLYQHGLQTVLKKTSLDLEKALQIEPRNRLSAELPAGLLAAALGIGGGCFTLDAACASSLYAIKLACEELNARRADAVLTGGVSRPSSQFTQMGFSQLRALSAKGICRPFDADADGLIVGEGAGLFVLKRLEDAISAGDTIHAVIRGIGLANDVGGSLLAPDSEGQLRAMHSAYRQAGWQPDQVQLVECHGTGTPKGDAVEFDSLRKLWQQYADRRDACVIGSVKSNVGHLLTGAGAAGLMKLIFALKNAKLPPTANFKTPDPAMDMTNSPFTVLRSVRDWQPAQPGQPRRCALSAFGFGGIDAHVLLEEYQPGTTESSKEEQEPEEIAIVALAARAGDTADFYRLQQALLKGESLGADNGVNRHSLANVPDWVKKGAYINDLKIPFGRFKISPNEIPQILPQQLLMLMTVEDAWHSLKSPRPSNLRQGVFMGINLDLDSTNFATRWSLKRDLQDLNIETTNAEALKDALTPPLNHPRTVGALGGIVASRIAREYQCGGPSHTFSAAENSGLAAFEAAIRSLQRQETDLCLVGAVEMAGDLRNLLVTDRLRPYSRNGDFKPFSEDSTGTVIGEGAVALLLKRLSDAEKDNDRILAVVKGIGKASRSIDQDPAAAISANKRAMADAWRESQLNPENLGLLEASGTGCPAQDKIEATSFAEFFKSKDQQQTFQNNDQLCALASVKTVTGHTGAAAGLFSLARATTAIYQQVLPAMPGLERPIEALSQREDFFFTPSRPQYWLRNRIAGPRLAAVNSTGLDGSFYHVVLAEYENDTAPNVSAVYDHERIFPVGQPDEMPFLIEGDDACELREKLSALKNLQEEDINTLAANYWQQTRRNPQSRLAVAIVADNFNDLHKRASFAIDHLNRQADKAISPGPEVNDRVFFDPNPVGKTGKIAFVFPGSGNHFLGMGCDLGLTWPEHLRNLDRQYELLAAQFAPKRIVPWRLSWPQNWEELAMRDLIYDHNSLVFSHVSTCALISDIVRNFGVEPEIIMGYSLGETAGNFATRTWRERDEMVRRMRRSQLFTTDLIGNYNSARKHWGLGPEARIDWALGVIHCPAAEVEKIISDFPQTYVLIENTASECVIGGNRPQVEALVKKIGKAFFPLDGVSSVHCPAALPVADQYRALHLYECHPPDGMTFISSGLGTVIHPERDVSADSIEAQCIGRINFPRCVETAWENGARVFLELGPRSSMSRMIASVLGNRQHFARSAMLFGQNQNSSMVRFIANLAAQRVKIDFSPLFRTSALGISSVKDSPRQIIVPVGNRIDFAELAARTLSTDTKLKQSSAGLNSGTQVIPPQEPRQKTMTAAAIAADTITSAPAGQYSNLGTESGVTAESTLISGWLASQQATARAHDAFLRFSNRLASAQTALLEKQLATLQGLSEQDIAEILAQPLTSTTISAPVSSSDFNSASAAIPSATYPAQPATPPQIAPLQPVYKYSRSQQMPRPYSGPLILDQKLSMEFATGQIGKALGEFFAPIDTHPTRVRLPDIPLNFVDRITLIEGEKGSLGKGRVITEHDVYPNTWYLDNDCMPTGLAVEAGQADLFLSGWLGIDFKTKGIAKYRLLDAVVTFHGPLPRPGDTIHYDIRVDRFIRQADTYLFFFEFDGSIDGRHLITMRNGCAGFFTDKQLADGKGIVLTADDIRPDPRPDLPGRELLPPMVTESFGDLELDALRRGDLGAAFGGAFTGITISPQTLPDGRMKMIDRITEISPRGGRFGLGQIKAEIDIPQDAWFLTQHFCDDPVMPGTLMYESCMQSLRVFLMRMGWVVDAEIAAFEPVLEIQSQLRCRGQVIPGVKKALYEISIKELGYGPEPYAVADALMFADGNRIVQVLDMSIRLSGASRDMIEKIWADQNATQSGSTLSARIETPSLPAANAIDPEILPAIYTGQQILEYAIGRPSVCFGEQFKPFDSERFLARLPNPPYLFVDRITAVEAEFLKIKTGGHVQGQFDIRPDAWYFKANRQSSIPFSVLLEFPLQVCGWYSCFMGSAFTNDKELHYRNLDGTATLYEDVHTGTGTLTADVYSTKAANSAGMLIQSFKFVVSRQGRKVYEGDTTFGFFSVEALANQVGLRGVELYEPDSSEKSRARQLPFGDHAPFLPEEDQLDEFNGLIMPGKAYKMLDRIEMYIADGGPARLGFIRGSKKVNPADWFFKAHFYQDPVIPGSLGLESFLQLLKAVAIDRWGNELSQRRCNFEPMAIGMKHTWSYRGQVIPKDDLVTVDACITRIDDQEHLIVADGFLKVDGRIIYSMKDFALKVDIKS
jgi:acyl transferase domain-containing protein/3-hydroxymyristoyl/3-hydroxydecanoyl-(acyl carrier protein) dehydratase